MSRHCGILLLRNFVGAYVISSRKPHTVPGAELFTM